MRWIRLAPVSAESLIICVAVFASCLFQAASSHESFEDVQRTWGAIVPQEQFVAYDGIRREKEAELYGPFDVWDGEWWRIPITPFHHASLMHLVLCVGATWYLGSRLERHWGSVLTGLFLFPALTIPVIAELSIGRAMEGFSGVICSLLGAILVLRECDRNFAEEIPAEAGEIGMALILLGWIASLFGLTSFPDAAHLSGFCYGATIAWMTRNITRHHRWQRVSLVLAHLWILPGLFFASHPYWNGRYHWYCAVTAPTPHRVERSLEKAITYDPSLTGAWLYWSQMAEDREHPELAWKRIIQGLYHNPSSSTLMDGSRRLWRHLNVNQRRQVEYVLEEYFADRSQVWLNQIRASSNTPINESDSESGDLSEVIDLREFKLDQRQELPPINLSPSSLDRQNPVKPIIPQNAAEGETL